MRWTMCTAALLLAACQQPAQNTGGNETAPESNARQDQASGPAASGTPQEPASKATGEPVSRPEGEAKPAHNALGALPSGRPPVAVRRALGGQRRLLRGQGVAVHGDVAQHAGGLAVPLHQSGQGAGRLRHRRALHRRGPGEGRQDQVAVRGVRPRDAVRVENDRRCGAGLVRGVTALRHAGLGPASACPGSGRSKGRSRLKAGMTIRPPSVPDLSAAWRAS